MTLLEKLSLLNLSEEEKSKATEKFIIPLSLVSDDELRDLLSYLVTEGVTITKAREIKALCNSKDEISKKFSIMGEIHETELYKQDPLMLNKNVIDIYKKIKYCMQIGKPYRKEDGSYEPFLFSESAWQQEVSSEPVVNVESDDNISLEDNLVTMEPTIEEIVPVIDDIQDIGSFVETIPEEKVEEAKTTNFADIRKQLEDQLAELDSLRNDDNVISFDDIGSETYEIRRAA